MIAKVRKGQDSPAPVIFKDNSYLNKNHIRFTELAELRSLRN